jgi:predicted thioesterase
MEESCCDALNKADVLKGKTSVGVSLDFVHRKPSALGAHVTAVSHIKQIEGKSVSFEVEASDETGVVGSAKHKRVFVDKERFEANCNEAAQFAREKSNGS